MTREAYLLTLDGLPARYDAAARRIVLSRGRVCYPVIIDKQQILVQQKAHWQTMAAEPAAPEARMHADYLTLTVPL